MAKNTINDSWVCLKIGYIPNYSHLIGIMISKTIGFRGLAYFQTHPHKRQLVELSNCRFIETQPGEFDLSKDCHVRQAHPTQGFLVMGGSKLELLSGSKRSAGIVSALFYHINTSFFLRKPWRRNQKSTGFRPE